MCNRLDDPIGLFAVSMIGGFLRIFEMYRVVREVRDRVGDELPSTCCDLALARMLFSHVRARPLSSAGRPSIPGGWWDSNCCDLGSDAWGSRGPLWSKEVRGKAIGSFGSVFAYRTTCVKLGDVFR